MAKVQEEIVEKRQTTYKVEPYSQRFKDWILNRTTLGVFINYGLNKDYPALYHSLADVKNNFVTPFKYTLTGLFPFEGYDLTSQQITYHNNKKDHVYKDHQFGWLTFLAFFGLPTRPYAVAAEDGTFNPKLRLIDVVVNLFGGWKSPSSKLTPTQYWLQLISFFTIKPFVIFPLNVVTGLFKFCVNTVKLAIFIPMRFVGFILHEIIHFLLTSTRKVTLSDWPLMGKVPATFFLGILSLTSLLEIPLIISHRILQAILAPLTSMQYHLAKGRSVKILSDSTRKFYAKALDNYDPKVPPADPIADTIGYTSALVSFAITAIAWAFILSLAIGAITTFFPALIPAVVATFGWVAQLPFIAGALGIAQSIVGLTVIPSIIGFLTPYISTLSAFLGLQASLTLLTTAATVGFSAALIGVPLTYAANEFSNWYVSWYGTQSAATVLNPKKSAEADDFNSASDDENNSDNKLDNKKLLVPHRQKQASVETGKGSTNNSAQGPRGPAKKLTEEVQLSQVQTVRRDQQASATGEAAEISLQPQHPRTALFNRDTDRTRKAKALLETDIGNRYQIGEAFSRGDCFYDAFAQGLNELKNTGAHTIKSLRTQCANIVRSFKANSPEQKWLQKLIPDQGNLAAYNMKVDLTADECTDVDFSSDKHAIWGNPDIDGVLLCKKYGVNLHIIDIHEHEAEEDSDSKTQAETLNFVSHRLITPTEPSKTMDLDKIPVNNTITIMCYHEHYVPAFPTHNLNFQFNN